MFFFALNFCIILFLAGLPKTAFSLFFVYLFYKRTKRADKVERQKFLNQNYRITDANVSSKPTIYSKSINTSQTTSQPLRSSVLLGKRSIQKKTTIYSSKTYSLQKKSDIDEDTVVTIRKKATFPYKKNILIKYTNTEKLRKKNEDSDQIWIGKNDTIEISGIKINDGLFYISDRYETPDAPYLIRKQLSISTQACSPTIKRMNYWPNYSSITPEARKAYLTWLADGKKAPDADIGYVFLFFYGLEHRFCEEIQNDMIGQYNEEDIKEIKEEVLRLLNIYTNNNSFHSYASQFLDYISLYEKKNNIFTEFYSKSLAVKIKIGELLYQQQNIPIDLCSEYILQEFENVKRTPAVRCENETKNLIQKKLKEKFNDGINIVPKEQLPFTFYYHPASLYISKSRIELDNVISFLPDEDLKNCFLTIFDKAKTDLEAYSKRLKISGGNKFLSKLYLPDELINETFKEVISKIENNIIDCPIISIKELFSFFDISQYINEKNWGIIKNILKKFDLYTYMDSSFSEKTNILLSKNKENDIDILKDLKITSYIIYNILNKTSNYKKREIILEKIASSNDDLAILRFFLFHEYDDTFLKKYFINYKREKKYILFSQVISCITDVLGNSSDIEENMNSFIKRYMPKNMPERKKIDNVKRTSFYVDYEKLESIQNETAVIQKELSEIISDSDEQSMIPNKSFINANVSNESLDKKHTEELSESLQDIIYEITVRASWSLKDFKEICAKHHSMMNSMIEKINEWSDENLGDFLLEEENGAVIVNQDLMKN